MGKERTDTVLIMMDAHLGNFLVCSPVLSKVARAHAASLTVIDSANADLARRIVGFPERFDTYASRSGALREVAAFLSLARGMRRMRPQLLLNFGGRSSGALLGACSKAAVRICPEGDRHVRFYHRLVPQPLASAHRTEWYGSVARAGGVEGPWDKPRVASNAEDAAALEVALSGHPHASVVCLHVTQGKRHKHWPLDRYARFVDQLWKRDLLPVLIGSTPDLAAAEHVARLSHEPPFNLVNRLAIGPLIALLQRCRLFIGNDSGPMHLAAAAGAPIIALFGPTSPNRWAPLTDKAVILQGTEPLRPGEGVKNNPDGRRMESIGEDTVLTAIDQQLSVYPNP
jgi:heptosyltransferase III